ncbi:oxygen-insensitive NADPH nitroreductase [Sporosarcina sp. GW1-11]|uniref:oxygen-insensitive NADPH nitroreductase n=1 Tax=Sporosarcina sp. GW1-11 TaxID=2899126 RepID=UPI00294D358D|nr:oxygen-insensitive NADPH nitroreductase [Sporosarcina sp. GW1-11]MDV6378457.1 oxygen-insensitive NADPH nitroreductase [Sporosarcina sp. GW1-11]
MVIELLTSHSSVRRYKDEPISKETIIELIKAGQHAASSHFVQACSVIYVTDTEKRGQLAELSKNRRQFYTAGATLVFCMDYNRLSHAARLHGREIDYSVAENVLVGAIDVGLFAQNVVIAAESKGYGICYIGGVRNEIEEISNILELPKGVVPLFGMSIGVPNEANGVKPRLPIEAVLHENTYNEEQYKEVLPAYDKIMQEYYASRESNQRDAKWTEEMADFLETPKRPHIKAFLEKQGFLFN